MWPTRPLNHEGIPFDVEIFDTEKSNRVVRSSMEKKSTDEAGPRTLPLISLRFRAGPCRTSGPLMQTRTVVKTRSNNDLRTARFLRLSLTARAFLPTQRRTRGVPVSEATAAPATQRRMDYLKEIRISSHACSHRSSTVTCGGHRPILCRWVNFSYTVYRTPGKGASNTKGP